MIVVKLYLDGEKPVNPICPIHLKNNNDFPH